MQDAGPSRGRNGHLRWSPLASQWAIKRGRQPRARAQSAAPGSVSAAATPRRGAAATVGASGASKAGATPGSLQAWGPAQAGVWRKVRRCGGSGARAVLSGMGVRRNGCARGLNEGRAAGRATRFGRSTPSKPVASIWGSIEFSREWSSALKLTSCDGRTGAVSTMGARAHVHAHVHRTPSCFVGA